MLQQPVESAAGSGQTILSTNGQSLLSCTPGYDPVDQASGLRQQYDVHAVGTVGAERHGLLDVGRKVTLELVRRLIPEKLAGIRQHLGEQGYAAGKYDLAAMVFEELTADDAFVEFLTLPCYEYLD